LVDRASCAHQVGGTDFVVQPRMVVVDIDHPDIEDYINWKVRKRAESCCTLLPISKVVSKHLKVTQQKACVNCEGPERRCFDVKHEPAN